MNQKTRKIPNISGTISYKTALKLFLQIRKKRIILSVISGILAFVILSSLLLTWYAYRYNAFQTHLDKKGNWLNDQKISVYQSEVTGNVELDFNHNYLDDVIDFFQLKMNLLIPGITSEKYTGLMSIELYNAINQPSYSLGTFDSETSTTISESLIAGRMPTNSSELLYYKEQNVVSNIEINDTISLFAIENQPSYKLTFTVVGIIENLYGYFDSNGLSKDILKWEDYIDIYNEFESTVRISKKLFTIPIYFYDILNSYPEVMTVISTLIDFNYNNLNFNVKRLTSYVSILEETRFRTNLDYSTLYGEESFTFNKGYYWNIDLYEVLSTFNLLWIQETIRIFAISLPLLSLLYFLSLEILNIGKTELTNIFQKMKTLGLKYKTIRKLILSENLIITIVSSVCGIILGIVVGLLFSYILKFNFTISIYFSGLIEPLVIFSITLFTLSFFIGGYIIEVNLLKKTVGSRSEQLQKIRQRILRKLFAIQEFATLIPGLLMLIIGISGLFLIRIPKTIFNETQTLFQINLFIFLAIIAIGSVLSFISVFYLFSRIFTVALAWFSKKIWKVKRNVISLSLKDYSSDFISYRRLVIVMLIFSLCFIPGTIIHKDYQNQINLESNLALGCSDLRIDNWTNNQTIFNNLTNMNGIDKISVIVNYEFEYFDNFDWKPTIEYSINLLAIENVSLFLETIDLTKLDDISYSPTDILSLSALNSYLMSKKHALKNNYHKDSIFYNSELGRPFYEYNLTFINFFEFFPALPLKSADLTEDQLRTFSLVTSLETAEMLETYADEPNIKKENRLLLRIIPGTNISQIKQEIETNYNLDVVSFQDIYDEISYQKPAFILFLFILISIITSIVLTLFGIFTARIIYQHRKRIVETKYRLGINRNQIILSFIIEIIAVSFMPILISTLIGFPLLQFLDKFLLTSSETYKIFSLNMPWWLIVSVFLIEFLLLFGGWFLLMNQEIHRYKPIRQE
jgi:hypothetical protein